MPFKQPVSVLVLVHTPDLEVLLLERASNPGYWQSVTGSREGEESLTETAIREVLEETGIDATRQMLREWHVINRYAIYTQWRHRYAPGVTHNTEHVFDLTVAAASPVRLAPGEHLNAQWLPWRAAAEKVFSWSNRNAILMLPERIRWYADRQRL